MKNKETLEGFAIKIAQLFGTKDSFEYIKNSVKYGAKWKQDKKLYSEEEVIQIVLDLRFKIELDSTREEIKEWFEQFKKK